MTNRYERIRKARQALETLRKAHAGDDGRTAMADLIGRLRAFEGSDELGNGDFSLLREAADALEALRAEVAEWKRVAAAQAELHDKAEARADKLEKTLRTYQKAVNRIDDLIEYALPMPRETKGALYSVLADLTEELVKVSKENGQKEAQEL